MRRLLPFFLLVMLAGLPVLALGWDTPDFSGKMYCSEEQVNLIEDGPDSYDEDEADEDI